MHTLLLSRPASGQRLRSFLSFALGLLLLLGSSAVRAQTTIYALGTLVRSVSPNIFYPPGGNAGEQGLVGFSVSGAPSLQPLRIALQSVGREGAAPCLAGLISREAQTNTIISQRACGIEERWTNEREGLAHAFVVKHAPEGTGGLTLRLSFEGPWHHEDARGHVFKGPGAAALLRYGNAFVVREGQRLPITVRHVDGGLELRIPRAMVDAKNAFPMIIDPLLSAEVPLDSSLRYEPPPTSEEAPAIAVNSQGMAMVGWVEVGPTVRIAI